MNILLAAPMAIYRYSQVCLTGTLGAVLPRDQHWHGIPRCPRFLDLRTQE